MLSGGRFTGSLPVLWVGVLIALFSPSLAWGTVLRFDTSLGNIDVRMFNSATPASVANFMNYVDDDDYDDSFFHRMPDTFDDHGNYGTFVLQGGGFKYDSTTGLSSIPSDPPVVNEPGISNLKYTLAYAKQGGDPNSATSGFFFNTQDNANNLDNQNGGFTVFGRIVAGFDVLDDIAELPFADLDGNGQTFNTVPVFPEAETLAEALVYLNDVVELDIPAGDFNFDGQVNLADYTLWRDTLDSRQDVRADGNGNGVVDLADLDIWKANFGLSSSTAVAAVSAVPEPTAIVLAVLLGGLLWWGAKKAGLE